jgi:hypothetical protein
MYTYTLRFSARWLLGLRPRPAGQPLAVVSAALRLLALAKNYYWLEIPISYQLSRLRGPILVFSAIASSIALIHHIHVIMCCPTSYFQVGGSPVWRNRYQLSDIANHLY